MDIYPTYTIGAIFVVGVVQSILVWLALSAAILKLDSTRGFKHLARIGLAALLAAWFSFIFTLSQSDTQLALTASGGHSRVLLALFAPAFASLLLLGSQTVRTILDKIPQHQLIGFQGMRTLGFIFLVLTDMGFVSPSFGVAAGIGDVFVGVFALYAAYALLRGRAAGRSIAIAANVIGLLDATMALMLGLFVVPAESFAPQIVTSIMFVPSYIVAIFLVAHLYSLRGLFLGVGEAGSDRIPCTAAHPEQSRDS